MKKSVAALIALLLQVAAFAQGTIRVETHNIVGLDEQFNVVFVIDGDSQPSSFSWSAGEDFDCVWGPQKGSSTSISIVNGKHSRTSQTTYTYILKPRRTGAFSLPAATAKMGGQDISSGRFTIQVVDNGSQAAAPSQGGSQAQQGSAQRSRTEASSQEEIFMKFSISSTSAVVGEPITATLKLFQRANIAGFEDVKLPTFNGFWSTETEAPQNIEFHREQVGDKIYNAAVLRRYTLIPQKQGDLVIDPAELVCLVNVRTRASSPQSIFDAFFQDNVTTVRRRVSTPAVTVHVGGLPAGAPASFAGGVGEFSVSGKVTKDSLKTHEAASLLLTVSGKGNIALVDAPKVSFPVDFEVYDVKATKQVSSGGTSGSKVFEYPFIPRSHGDFVIPPVKYSYYNVKSRRYVTVQTDSLRISVARGTETVVSSDGSGVLTVDKRGVKTLGEDIRFIRVKASSLSTPRMLVSRPLYWIIAIFMVLGAAALWLSMRRIAALRSDVALSRKRRATKMAMRRPKLSGDFLRQNLPVAFYEELHRALIGFISDKLSMNMAEQTKENIASSLTSRGISEENARAFTALLDECEYARYAPSAGNSSMKEHYDSAVRLITAIDGSIKSPSMSGTAAMLLWALLIPSMLFAPSALRASEALSPEMLWERGVEAYSAADYESAAGYFQKLVDSGHKSADVYFNLGNSLLKQRETGRAILNYERALRLDPSNEDVRYNLEFARSQTIDKIDQVPEFFLTSWMRTVCYSLPSNVWAVISLFLLAVTLALVLLFLLGRTSAGRKAGFFTAIAALLLTLLCWNYARMQYRDSVRQDEAVVVKAVVAAKSSPSDDSSKDLFVLHEGTKVSIRESVSTWLLVSIEDGRQGWISENSIEVI